MVPQISDIMNVSLGRGANGIIEKTEETCSKLQHPLLPSANNSLGQSLTSMSSANDAPYDLICVGFGPASLAVAIALHDVEGTLAKPHPRVLFLERQQRFRWHAGMLLPGAKMQISFIKDLATLRNPRSHFTFLNYLKEHGRLVDFSNLGTFLPTRLEFEDYLAWAAGHFRSQVDYGQEVEGVRPVSCGGLLYDAFEVCSRDVVAGGKKKRLAKNVVIAVGGRAVKPPVFPEHHPRILHSSVSSNPDTFAPDLGSVGSGAQDLWLPTDGKDVNCFQEYNDKIAILLPVKEKAYQIAVVGNGQSAAEVFNDLQSRYPGASTKLVIRDTALRPSDDSPFVNEIFNPEAVDAFYDQSEEVRRSRINKDRATNYGVIRLELLEKMYAGQYLQSVRERDRTKWKHQIMTCREVVEVVDMPENKTLNLVLENLDTPGCDSRELVPADAVILATGYRRDAHVDMLKECRVINSSRDGLWKPQRDYSVELDRSLVSRDVGIWLQGCNEKTHGLADSLLSVLATRSGELVNSIFGHQGVVDGN